MKKINDFKEYINNIVQTVYGDENFGYISAEYPTQSVNKTPLATQYYLHMNSLLGTKVYYT
jgi:hypothetical protein